MSNYAELKRLAEVCIAAGEYHPGDAWNEDRRYSDEEVAFLEFSRVASPHTILELMAENESLRKDALRYRKIREGAIHDEVDAGIYILDQRGEKYQECAVMISEDDLDNAIDSAMSKEP